MMNRHPTVIRNGKLIKNLTPWLFLLPSITILITFLIIPIIESFRWSVLDYKILLGTGKFVGFDNFQEIFSDDLFWKALVNTILFVIIVLPMNIFLPMILASLVNQKIRSIGSFRVLYYVPVVTPIVVGALMWKMLYSQNGAISNFLVSIGILDAPINFLANTTTALVAVAFITAWKGLGYYMIMYLANLQSIPNQLYESADIDGANIIQKFTRITMPMLVPTITLVSVLTIVNGLKVFEEIALTTNGGPAGATTTLVMYIYDKFSNLDVSIASAAGIVLLILAIVGSLIQMKLTSKREDDLRA